MSTYMRAYSLRKFRINNIIHHTCTAVEFYSKTTKGKSATDLPKCGVCKKVGKSLCIYSYACIYAYLNLHMGRCFVF